MTILKGLQLIDAAGLPHPDWQFVRSSDELQSLEKISSYCGWTIRTVDLKGVPWKNVYANWVLKKQVPAKVDELQEKQKGRATFVVYPSWKWKKGGTVLLETNRIVIESTDGPIVQLMREGKLTASYIYEKNRLTQIIGQEDFLSAAERRVVLSARKVKKKNVLLEWGISTQGKFIFYRIEDIKEAARLLLEKYG